MKIRFIVGGVLFGAAVNYCFITYLDEQWNFTLSIFGCMGMLFIAGLAMGFRYAMNFKKCVSIFLGSVLGALTISQFLHGHGYPDLFGKFIDGTPGAAITILSVLAGLLSANKLVLTYKHLWHTS